jgi:hypothetical protein
MVPVRRVIACYLGIVILAAALAAQPQEELGVHVYALRYQQAIDAIPLIQPLLSKRGTIELQPAENTLVIRDTSAALGLIMPRLRNFDHPAQALKLEILIVRASRSTVSPQERSDLPEETIYRLRHLLPYDVYQIQAQSQFSALEGQAVAYNLGEEYEVSFRLGTLLRLGGLREERIKLTGFQVGRRVNRKSSGAPLIRTETLALVLDQTLSLGLAHNEASREALIILLTVHRGEARPRAEQP